MLVCVCVCEPLCMLSTRQSRFILQVVGGVAGTFFGACQVAWFPDPVMVGQKKKDMALVGGRATSAAVARSLLVPAVWFALGGAVFSFVDCTAAATRQRKDHWNSVYGGMATGIVLAAMTKRFDSIPAASLGLGLVLGGAEYISTQTSNTTTTKAMDVKEAPAENYVENLKKKYPKFKNL